MEEKGAAKKRALPLSASAAARASRPHAPSNVSSTLDALGARGFAVARGFLTREELRVLRRECDALSAATSAAAIVRQGCVLDVFAQCPIRDDDAARVDARAYVAARSAQLDKIAACSTRQPSLLGSDVASDDVDVLDGDPNVMERLLFQRLPMAVVHLLQDKSPPSMDQHGEQSNDVRGSSDGSSALPLFFFNEHYVVKPPASEVEFRWHRDDDEQLGMCVHRAEVAPYVSAWCALDDVTPENGPLRFLPLDDPASDVADAPSDGLEPRLGPGEAQLTAFDANATAPLHARAGDVLFFLSNVWHASSANESSAARRAFYAQFSTEKITAGPRDPSPLSFAIPCAQVDCEVADDSESSSKRLRVSSQGSNGPLTGLHGRRA